MYEDAAGLLWVATNTGVISFNFRTHETNYNRGAVSNCLWLDERRISG